MAVTIKDIARKAGVSHTTVSRALLGNPAIADDTAARIRQIAGELGYVPNTVARSLKTSRSGVLGVIVRRIVDPFFAEVLQGIEDVLHAQGYSLFLAASNRDPERERLIFRAMSERRVDGVIICSTQVSEARRLRLEAFGVPTVLINNQAPERTGHSIYHDDAYGGRQVARHLILLGHRRIGYLGNARAGQTTNERLRGFRQEMAAAGLVADPNLIIDGANGLAAGGAEGAARFLALDELPTAIICYNDMMAIGAMQRFAAAGVDVPATLSVTGFDDIELAAYAVPALTTFDQPKMALGTRAAGMMLRLLSENGHEAVGGGEIEVLRGRLVVRDSTGSPMAA